MNMVLEEVSFFTNISYPLFFHTLFFPSSFFLLMLPSPEEATNLIKGLEYLLYKEAEKVGAIKPTEEKKKLCGNLVTTFQYPFCSLDNIFLLNCPAQPKGKTEFGHFLCVFCFSFFFKLII